MNPLLLILCLIMWSDGQASDTKNVRPEYETETWPVARLLVWAKPGQNGTLREPSNWLENGKPALTGVDRDTDLLLPASDKEYLVSGDAKQMEVRHVTVEKNARLVGEHFYGELNVWGNVDVKSGGRIKYLLFVGEKHTYIRVADGDFPGHGRPSYSYLPRGYPANSDHCGSYITHKLQVCKYGNGSVELIGNYGVGDEVMIQNGRCIINGVFRFNGQTNKGAFQVFKGGILELQSGATLAPFRHENSAKVYNVAIYPGGELRAGSSLRPLTKDCYLLLGQTNRPPDERTAGLYVAKGAALRVFSADPAKARLVITALNAIDNLFDGLGKPVSDPARKAEKDTGIVLQLAGDLALDGVLIDYAKEGGIRLPDPAVAKAWKQVSFGASNATSSEGLVAQMTDDPNVAYHKAAARLYIYEKAISTMDQYLAQKYALAVNLENAADGKRVTLTLSAKAKEIRYTIDGSTPTAMSPLYATPLVVPVGTVVKCRPMNSAIEMGAVATIKTDGK